LENEQNKSKLVRKFLKYEGSDFAIGQTLVGHLIDRVWCFKGDAQRNFVQCIGFIIHYRNSESTEEDIFSTWPESRVDLLLQKVIHELINANTETNIATFSSILKKMIEHDSIHHSVIHSEARGPLFECIFNRAKLTNFVITTEAFTLLEEILNQNQKRSAAWMLDNYDEFMQEYITLVEHEEFVVQRQALRLLCDILEAKAFRRVMLKFVASKPYLKKIMVLLNNEQDVIAFETFHVFKLFLGNPKKHPDVYSTLFKNKEPLRTFLEGFQSERTEDEGFLKTKNTLLDVLRNMEVSPDEYREQWEQNS